MSINRVPIYIFGISKHHRVMICSWFPSVRTLPSYRSLRRPVIYSSIKCRGMCYVLHPPQKCASAIHDFARLKIHGRWREKTGFSLWFGPPRWHWTWTMNNVIGGLNDQPKNLFPRHLTKEVSEIIIINNCTLQRRSIRRSLGWVNSLPRPEAERPRDLVT